jgi:hypothetical protein
MKIKNIISTLLSSLLLLSGSQVYANTYFLNQSNTLADGVNYAQVDVLESGGNLNFTVQALTPTNWKFSNFYFNLGGSTGKVTLMGLPSGWSADTNQNVSEFDVFSNGGKGKGNSLQSIFSFTADGKKPLSFANLVANEDGWIFAAHMQCQSKKNNPCSAVEGEKSHHIAGPEISPVPIPGAIWLFGSALIGFVSMSNRRKV